MTALSPVQCYLKIGEKVAEGIESKEARRAFMKANMDAGFAAELYPDYAKAHYRKGLSLLGMPETQQRSKEAVAALQTALKCPDMAQEMAVEVNKVLHPLQVYSLACLPLTHSAVFLFWSFLN